MKWFAVNCIFQIISGDGAHSPQFNEQTRLVLAADFSKALDKAKSRSGDYNKSFKNFDGQQVRWEFIGFGSIIEIDEPADGVEVSSQILEPHSAAFYLERIAHRNKMLTQHN
jgi:hypothetical protein